MALFPLGILSAAGAGGAPAGSYDLLESQILGSNQSSVTFSSLGTYASDYKHLQIRLTARTTRTDFNRDELWVRLNGDTGNNYTYHILQGSGSLVNSSGGTGINGAALVVTETNLSSSGVFSPSVLDFLDPYATKNKTIRSVSSRLGTTGTSATVINLASSVWLNTTALTSINFFSANAYDIVTGSRFSLYGIKG
jgi:hypothetical protein